ncbi:MAG: prephenate dehydratase [Gammaproteobacteria bacterium]|nr:prephenate dehydratase [Gammaproteobacteria bacterium]
MNKKTLSDLRQQIDAVDRQLLNFISERANLAQQIAQVKAQSGEGGLYYRPDREASVLKSVLEHNQGPLSDEEMARLIREIMSACLALEQRLQVAFLGPSGTFTEEAAYKHFGHSIQTLATNNIDDVFREVESDNANYGVVPIENSTQGIVNSTLDMFLESTLSIVGEVELRVHQHLLSNVEKLADIQVIYSHQQSLAQCKKWLETNLPGIKRVPVGSNADAAKRAASEKNAAAIASETAASVYNLTIQNKRIEDSPDNTTRFLIIGKQEVEPTGDDKTTLLISARNKPGALYSLLQPLAKNNVSMTRIESRPSHCVNWEYVFFLDLEGHIKNDTIKNCIAELKTEADLLKVLGSYPRAVL